MASKKLRIVPRLNLASEDGVGITLEDTGVDVHAAEDEKTEIEVSFEEKEKEAVQAALRLLDKKGVKKISLAGKKAKFFSIDDPEAPVNYEQMARETRQAYRGKGKSLSNNDAYFFTPSEEGLPEAYKVASGNIEMPIADLANIIRNATEIGARNATDVVFTVLKNAGYDLRPMAQKRKRAGLADNFGKPGKTNIQSEIESSHPPTRGMVDSVEFDKIKPDAIKSLEFVSGLPFDSIDSAPKAEKGRKIGPGAIPSKVMK